MEQLYEMMLESEIGIDLNRLFFCGIHLVDEHRAQCFGSRKN